MAVVQGFSTLDDVVRAVDDMRREVAALVAVMQAIYEAIEYAQGKDG